MMEAFQGSGAEWNALIKSLPSPHFLQSWEWAQLKSTYGWIAMPFVWRAADGNVAAVTMILKRQINRRGFAARASILYAPKGPLLDWRNAARLREVLDDLESFARKQGAIFLKCDADVVLRRGLPLDADDDSEAGPTVRSELSRRGWRPSAEQIQFKNTILIDLVPSEDELIARMKQKTRYNVRLAEKKGVTVREGRLEDLSQLYAMYAETSVRDGFVIRDEEYYRSVWSTFMQNNSPHAVPLIAELDGEALAALFLFTFAGRAYYVYGMSREAQREKMPAYLLQWEAIKHAKRAGCETYDLWGAPDDFDESDSLWGVYRFKQGLGGEVLRTLGAWDYAPNKWIYKLYAEVMPRVLDFMRARGKTRTRQDID